VSETALTALARLSVRGDTDAPRPRFGPPERPFRNTTIIHVGGSRRFCIPIGIQNRGIGRQRGFPAFPTVRDSAPAGATTRNARTGELTASLLAVAPARVVLMATRGYVVDDITALLLWVRLCCPGPCGDPVCRRQTEIGAELQHIIDALNGCSAGGRIADSSLRSTLPLGDQQRASLSRRLMVQGNQDVSRDSSLTPGLLRRPSHVRIREPERLIGGGRLCCPAQQPRSRRAAEIGVHRAPTPHNRRHNRRAGASRRAG
jgi:hypothetical protein